MKFMKYSELHDSEVITHLNFNMQLEKDLKG